jgi:pentatricopeptide repeat protein
MGEAMDLLKEMHLKNLVPHIVTYTCLIDGLCRYGKISYAWNLLKEMHVNGPPPDNITYSILLNALCKNQHLDEAILLFNQMIKSGLEPDVFCYIIMIDGYCKSKRIDETVNLFKLMHMKNAVPDIIATYTIVFNRLFQSGSISYAWQLVNMIRDTNPPPYVLKYLDSLLTSEHDDNKCLASAYC